MDAQKGFILSLATFIMWGVFPIYFKWIDGVDAVQILAHRIVWSFVLLFLYLWFSRRLRSVQLLLRNKKTLLALMTTGVLISTNWGVFIYAVGKNQILETSLGYFINPFFSILLGALLLGEKLNTTAKIASGLVLVSIAIQIYALGKLPFISLILPASFALYGFIRKKIDVPSFAGLLIETAIIMPFALIFLIWSAQTGQSGLALNKNGVLLVLSGLVTILPLLTYTAATHFLPLSTLGFMQYITPSISMLIAVFLYNEPLPASKLLGFALIWLGLGIMAWRHFSHKKRVSSDISGSLKNR
ncbi:MAG: EamA family transporter RarD [Neisseriaceae bacterium]|nr:EamA family transporter RarD [Neisseriaceae bacterium]